MRKTTRSKAEQIEKRSLEEAKYIITNNSTVREACKHFGVSKSTVFTDMTKILPNVSVIMYEGVRKVLDTNLSIRHLSGGKATREKYLKKV